MIFIDFQKSFDSLDRSKMFQILGLQDVVFRLESSMPSIFYTPTVCSSSDRQAVVSSLYSDHEKEKKSQARQTLGICRSVLTHLTLSLSLSF